MAAAINFAIGLDSIDRLINGGSGIGLYGSNGFGSSVAVNSYQDTTFITNSAGTAQAEQIDNNKFVNASSLTINGGGTKLLTELPNYLATFNMRFTNDTAVQCQNGVLRIYDRTNTDNDPSGVTCKIASVSHIATTQTNVGSGNTSWITPHGSSVIHTLLPVSPGISGLAPNGVGTTDSRHDFYVALSATPTSVGSKTSFGLFISLEYLSILLAIGCGFSCF